MESSPAAAAAAAVVAAAVHQPVAATPVQRSDPKPPVVYGAQRRPRGRPLGSVSKKKRGGSTPQKRGGGKGPLLQPRVLPPPSVVVAAVPPPRVQPLPQAPPLPRVPEPPRELPVMAELASMEQRLYEPPSLPPPTVLDEVDDGWLLPPVVSPGASQMASGAPMSCAPMSWDDSSWPGSSMPLDSSWPEGDMWGLPSAPSVPLDLYGDADLVVDARGCIVFYSRVFQDLVGCDEANSLGLGEGNLVGIYMPDAETLAQRLSQLSAYKQEAMDCMHTVHHLSTGEQVTFSVTYTHVLGQYRAKINA